MRRSVIQLTCLYLAGSIWGCGDDTPNETPDVQVDGASDAGDLSELDDGDALDTSDQPPADADVDIGADSDIDQARDSDMDLESDGDIGEPEPASEDCQAPFEGSPPPMGNWSLSMFHYNIQYVAGGTLGMAQIGFDSATLAPDFDYSETDAEDAIIRESLLPLLVMLERNPDFALTFEMQGFMVDVMRERHPHTLARMRALAEAGRLELASTHWSDQFFLAFGREDMDKSWELTQESFRRAELPLSNVVFTQEGQFGEGFAEWLAEVRPDAIMVMARNLQGFWQRDLVDQPVWSVNGTRVVLPRSLTTDSVRRVFNFFDDGELLATDDINPYFPSLFVYQEHAVRRYEARLRCETERGYTVGRISDYIEAVEAVDTFETPDMPPFIEGTWQPGSTRGPLRWMGGAGDVWKRHEEDNRVLTTCVAGRHQVLALQTLADSERGVSSEAEAVLEEAWRELLWGEVSDARGVNPWYGEVQYGLEHCGRARELASEALRADRAPSRAAGDRIAPREGAVAVGTAPAPPTMEVVEAPIDVTVTENAGRTPVLTWRRAEGAAGAEPWELTIEWPATEGGLARHGECIDEQGEERAWKCVVDPRPIAIHVPRTPGFMGFRPALSESIVRYTEADFSLDEDAFSDAAWTTAADGLVDLGDAFFVKDVTQVHLAIGWPAGEGRNDVVEIRDETLQRHLSQIWRFWYTTDEATALELASRNLNPVVQVDR